MRTILPILFVVAFSTSVSVVADDDFLPLEVHPVQIELDPQVLKLLSSPSEALTNALHDNRETDLMNNLGIAHNLEEKTKRNFPRKKLAFHKKYELGEDVRQIFVFDPVFHSWPGTQPETIVLTDASYRVLAWKEVGGSPMFMNAALEQDQATGPSLLITRKHRHTYLNPKQGVYRFSLSKDTITPNPNIAWLYRDEAERAQYDRWRKLHHER